MVGFSFTNYTLFCAVGQSYRQLRDLPFQGSRKTTCSRAAASQNQEQTKREYKKKTFSLGSNKTSDPFMHKYPGLTTRSPGTILKQTNKPTEHYKFTLKVHSPFQKSKDSPRKSGRKKRSPKFFTLQTLRELFTIFSFCL
jgi:hypothetical protein